MDEPSETPTVPLLPRRQSEAARVLDETCPFKCCAICGLQIPTCLTIAHLDQNPGNNAPENLARLCHTHHWMFDAGLYPVEAIRLLQSHWQKTEGRPSHDARLKGAADRAHATRRRKAAALKAVATRRRNASSPKPSLP